MIAGRRMAVELDVGDERLLQIVADAELKGIGSGFVFTKGGYLLVEP